MRTFVLAALAIAVSGAATSKSEPRQVYESVDAMLADTTGAVARVQSTMSWHRGCRDRIAGSARAAAKTAA